MSSMSEKEKDKIKKLQEKILNAMNDPPVYAGFTIKELAKEIDLPEPTARWNLEILEASGRLQSARIGKTKLFKRTEKK
jgi:predicted transcriptional regulator